MKGQNPNHDVEHSDSSFTLHPSSLQAWRQGELLEVTIANLNHDGAGVGRWEGRVVFVPDTVPGDRALVRLIRVKPQYAYGKLHQLLEASPHRIRPSCIVADKCGGCQWQHIDYSYQREAKRNLIIQDLDRIGGFIKPPVDPVLADVATDSVPTTQNSLPHPLIPRSLHPSALGYRNKATYPLDRSATGQVQAGYYQKGSHQLINLNQCPIQDSRLNPLLAEVKQDIQQRGWSIYSESEHRGKLRHLGLRIGRRTGELLLTLVSKDGKLMGLEAQAEEWINRYPQLVGVCLNVNPDRTNAIFGAETRCIAGRSYLLEECAGLTFQIQATTFFQVNTEVAEAMLRVIEAELALQGNELLVDAYCGIGTMTLPLAKQAKQAIGIEIQPEAIDQANLNAALNGITNVTFEMGAVEHILPKLAVQPDVVLLDPPRKGCDRTVLETLVGMGVDRIVYISCNPSTLARDLKLLSPSYHLTRVQPADFFPQTAHIECAAFLVRQNSKT
ncbi:MAG: 23S rRNA (uracil(1939)-C(5))-methyltransferase RlmD [Cyanobacteria bacterium CRU_2_1]|nr:23S rRNA (uracil(1939)-C(5))-methyltransferase RlmD [Cyanobacteria bacterium RU_5_0]NJR60063.1 23S rRNA (uracil(1939)-C(5))-methyltransferase RlmD [Cyanobacteria bacterium CRU_2_1]